MRVSEVLEKLAKCNPNAVIEIRGTVEDGYLCESDISIDNSNDDLIILDI